MSNASDRLKSKVAANCGVVVEKQKVKLSQLSTKKRNDLIDRMLKDFGYLE